jgi:hypothetical protein
MQEKLEKKLPNSSQVSKKIFMSNYPSFPLVVPRLNLVYHSHIYTGNFQHFLLFYVDMNCLR